MSARTGSPGVPVRRAHRAAAVLKPMLMGYLAAAAAFAFLGAGANPAADAQHGREDLVIDSPGGSARDSSAHPLPAVHAGRAGSLRSGRVPEVGPHLGDRSGDCMRDDARCIAERNPSRRSSTKALPNDEARNASAGLSR
jgi:hypothetical protein